MSIESKIEHLTTEVYKLEKENKILKLAFYEAINCITLLYPNNKNHNDSTEWKELKRKIKKLYKLKAKLGMYPDV